VLAYGALAAIVWPETATDEPRPSPRLPCAAVSFADSCKLPVQPPAGSVNTYAAPGVSEPGPGLEPGVPATTVGPSIATDDKPEPPEDTSDGVSFADSCTIPDQPPAGSVNTYTEPSPLATTV
jgi:hypothetical protein